MSHNLLNQPMEVGVGIDTHRYFHQVDFLDRDVQHAAAGFKFEESADGYAQLLQALAKIEERHDGVHFRIHLDAAGQYAVNLERFLRGLPFHVTVSVGEPARNKHYRQAIAPKRGKNDVTDAYACGRFAVVEHPSAAWVVPEEFQLLCESVRRLESQVRQTTRTISGLHNTLSRVFPELATVVSDLGAGFVLELLKKFPTPEKIARAARKSLVAIPYLSEEKADKIQAAAKRSIGSVRGEIAEQLVRSRVGEILHSRRVEKELENLVKKTYRALPISPHLQVQTIIGIGELTAAVLVAKIVSIDRFETKRQLVGYFGIFPEPNQSGKDRYGKDVPPGYMEMKLLHLVFAVWKTDCPFDRDHYPWDKAAPGITAQEETAGHKRDLPEKEVITAADSKVDAPAVAVKPEKSSPPASNGGWVDFAWLRQQVTMEQVLSAAGCLDELKKRGSQRRGRCPVHAEPGERDRSFSADLKKNVFQCFHPDCGVKGNVLDFWAAWRHLPLRDAALNLAETFHLQSPRNREEEPVKEPVAPTPATATPPLTRSRNMN